MIDHLPRYAKQPAEQPGKQEKQAEAKLITEERSPAESSESELEEADSSSEEEDSDSDSGDSLVHPKSSAPAKQFTPKAAKPITPKAAKPSTAIDSGLGKKRDRANEEEFLDEGILHAL